MFDYFVYMPMLCAPVDTGGMARHKYILAPDRGPRSASAALAGAHCGVPLPSLTRKKWTQSILFFLQVILYDTGMPVSRLYVT